MPKLQLLKLKLEGIEDIDKKREEEFYEEMDALEKEAHEVFESYRY
jgi:hypothetical protein